MVVIPSYTAGPFEDNAIPSYTADPAYERFVEQHVERELLQKVVEKANKTSEHQPWGVKATKGMAVKSAYSVELANGEIMTLEGSPGDLCLTPRISASRPATTCTGKVAVIVDAMAKDASFTDSRLDQLSGEMMVVRSLRDAPSGRECDDPLGVVCNDIQAWLVRFDEELDRSVCNLIVSQTLDYTQLANYLVGLSYRDG
ncbi:unnamed protein product [Vitrella brassicaformis CCMP3155]|uniref:Uncharacterized protein n=1 Tax=Vitrella brassicaformis (strain CCMP3155) TaxID=1169540 RepID=A0A0G4EMD8_VITBC|nr:unnamed protein product [Vitrella brassicaformis CCMP3155]|eukprot:CEL98160.1 unnamed protein product [Vitrella brassicaformis CCMP3155]